MRTQINIKYAIYTRTEIHTQRTCMHTYIFENNVHRLQNFTVIK